MIRSCNFTGRLGLDQQDVAMTVGNAPGQELSVDWSRCTKRVPADARIVIEAKTAGAMQSLRFEWGTWNQPRPPRDRSLTSLGATPFSFDVKAVDPTSGRIVAAVWNVRPVGEGDADAGASESLLWLNFEDLGQLSWSLHFGEDGVALNVNSRLPDAQTFAESPLFVALVFPAVVRIVLARALMEGADDDGEAWAQRWVAWARELKNPDFAVAHAEDGVLTIEHEAWIDDVVREFGARFETVDKVIAERDAK